MIVDHIAIKVKDVDKMQAWYEENLDAVVEAKNNVYARLRLDNTAITLIDKEQYRYGHLGILVDSWEELPAAVFRTTHRDGSIGVYCFDPEGNVIEWIWYPDKMGGIVDNEDKRKGIRRGLCQKVYDWGLSLLGRV